MARLNEEELDWFAEHPMWLAAHQAAELVRGYRRQNAMADAIREALAYMLPSCPIDCFDHARDVLTAALAAMEDEG